MSAPLCDVCWKHSARYRVCPEGAYYRTADARGRTEIRRHENPVYLSVCHGCLLDIRAERPAADYYLRWGSSTA